MKEAAVFYKVQSYSRAALCWTNLKHNHDTVESAVKARQEYSKKHPNERTRVLKLEQYKHQIVPTVVVE